MSRDLDTVIVTITDVRKAGYCVAGAKGWFRQQGIPFGDFLKTGIPASQMLATDDLGRRVVELKLERESHG